MAWVYARASFNLRNYFQKVFLKAIHNNREPELPLMKQLKIVACLALGVVVFLLVLAGADGYIVEFNRSAWLKVVLNVLLLFYRLLLEGPFLLITSSQEKKKNKGVYALTL